MNEIILKYRPVDFIPLTFIVKRNIASGWHEINGQLLQTITKFLYGIIPESKVLAELFQIKKCLAKKLNRYYKYKLFELFEFITELNPYHAFAIKKIGRLNAPGDKLKGVTFGCFIFSDTYFMNYQNDNKIEDLNKFIACLYRNKPFNENDIDKRVHKYINNIPLITKQAIALNYSLIKQWMAKQFPYIFIYKDIDKEKKKTKINKKQSGNWITLFDNIVGDDIVNSDKYANLPAMQVFRYLNSSQRKKRNHGSKT